MAIGDEQGLWHVDQAKEECRGSCQERDRGFPHLGQRGIFGSAHGPILPLVVDAQALQGVGSWGLCLLGWPDTHPSPTPAFSHGGFWAPIDM